MAATASQQHWVLTRCFGGGGSLTRQSCPEAWPINFHFFEKHRGRYCCQKSSALVVRETFRGTVLGRNSFHQGGP